MRILFFEKYFFVKPQNFFSNTKLKMVETNRNNIKLRSTKNIREIKWLSLSDVCRQLRHLAVTNSFILIMVKNNMIYE